MIEVCSCGIKFNPQTTGQKVCSICFYGLDRLERKTERLKIPKISTKIISQSRKEWLRKYNLLPRIREYKKLWARQAREKQRLKFGRILW